MRLYYAIIFLILLQSVTANSQDDQVFVQGGIMFPSIYSAKLEGIKGYLDTTACTRSSFFDLGYLYSFNNRLGIYTGLIYERKGWSQQITVYNTNTEEFRKVSRAFLSYSFISIPLLLEMETEGNISLFGRIGVAFGYRIGGKILNLNKYEVGLTHYYPEDLNPKLDISLVARSGLSFKINETIGCFVEGGYYLGLSKIGINTPTEREIKHKGRRIGIGIQYTIVRNPTKR